MFIANTKMNSLKIIIIIIESLVVEPVKMLAVENKKSRKSERFVYFVDRFRIIKERITMRCWMDFSPTSNYFTLFFSWFGPGPQEPTDRPWSKALQSFKKLDIITDIVYWSLFFFTWELTEACWTAMSAPIHGCISWLGFVVGGGGILTCTHPLAWLIKHS